MCSSCYTVESTSEFRRLDKQWDEAVAHESLRQVHEIAMV